MTEDLTRVLSQHPFVADMELRHVHFLAGCAKNVKFMAGDFLFREGKPATSLFLIREGEVALQVWDPARGTATLLTVVEGEVAGWSWFVEPYLAQFDAVATTPVLAFSLDAACVRRKCEADHEFGYQVLAHLLKMMEYRLQATRLQVLDVYGDRQTQVRK